MSCSMKREHDGINSLLQSLRQPRLLVLLGSGASTCLLPDKHQQLKTILRHRQNISALPVDGIAHDEVKDRVLIQPAASIPDLISIVIGRPYRAVEENRQWVLEYLKNTIPAASVHAIHLSSIAQSIRVARPIEYTIFRYVKPAVIATTNYDGLAERYCVRWGHKILHLHGKIPRVFSDNNFMKDMILDSFFLGDNIMMPIMQKYEDAGNLWLPQPELSSTIRRPEYERLISLFSTRSQLIIIGYSFAGRDDQQTFDVITDLLKFHPIPVTVVDPYPEPIIEDIFGNTKLTNVTGVKVKWGILAESMSLAREGFHVPPNFITDKVVELYSYIEEKNASN